MAFFSFSRRATGLLLIDVQDKLFSQVERPYETLLTMQKAIKGFQILQLPIFATEQYPQGLGPTIATLRACLPEDQPYFPKTTFSCLGTPAIRQAILESSLTQWVLIGIEAHVCVLQTAKDLLQAGKEVAVLNDAISSRSIYDFSTAIAEMRDCGVRITSAETILFELLESSEAPEFKEISYLIKQCGKQEAPL